MSSEQVKTKQWISDAEDALNRTGEALKTAWNETRQSRLETLEAARDAASGLGKAIDEGIEAARRSWDSSHSEGPADLTSANPEDDTSPTNGGKEEEE